MIGPIQVLVVGFDRPTFSGEVLAELARLREAGIVRLIDVLLVSRSEDGTLQTLEPPDGSLLILVGSRPRFLASRRTRARSIKRCSGPRRDQDRISLNVVLADAIPIGAPRRIALIEHLWAAPLSAAIQRAGGSPLEETWLARQDVEFLETLIARQDR